MGTGRCGVKENFGGRGSSLVKEGAELFRGQWFLGSKGQTAKKVEDGQRERDRRGLAEERWGGRMRVIETHTRQVTEKNERDSGEKRGQKIEKNA